MGVTMNIVLAGGTGFLGSFLAERLLADGHRLTLLSRAPQRVAREGAGAVTMVRWDGKSVGDLAGSIDGADAVVNLAGELIGGWRWTRAKKAKILSSRADATNALVEAIGRADKKPFVLISMSGVGYYGSVEDGDVTEEHPPGRGFLADVCRVWEAAAMRATLQGVRVVLLRCALVLGEGGPALARMVLPYRLFVGGRIGSGRQWFPWVHRADYAAIVQASLRSDSYAGPVTVAAPHCVTQGEFAAELGRALHRPSWMPVPAPVLRIALGEMASLVLTGQRVVPQVLVRAGYQFRFPELAPALADVLH